MTPLPRVFPAESEVTRSLVDARQLGGADVALLFASMAGQAMFCRAVDVDANGPWAGTTALLHAALLRGSAAIELARRQNLPLVMRTANLPAHAVDGAPLAHLDLPEWSAIMPLLSGRGVDGFLMLLMQREISFADAIDLTPAASRLAGALGRSTIAVEDAAQNAPLNGARAPAHRSGDTTAEIAPIERHAEGLQLFAPILRDGLIVVNASGGIVAINEIARDLLFALQPEDTTAITHPTLRDIGERAHTATQSDEIAIMVDGETRRWLHLEAAPATQAGTVLLALRDITDERLFHERLLQSEKMASIGQLVSGVAHELNNPLTGILGFAQLLLARDLADDARQDTEKIYGEAERASRIVQNLLSFARRRKPEKETVDINLLIERVFELRTYELRVRNIEPRTRLQRDIAPVLADPHQIQQVLLNVIRNAEHAIDARNSSGTITCSTTREADWAVIRISDTGMGIPHEHLRRVFDPFFTTKDVGEGTGLGLSISYGIIEEHGGRISIDSRVGKGTTVKIDLPFANMDATRSPVTAPAAEALALARHSILVIDDEPSIRELLATVLGRAGHEVEVVGDGESGLQRLAVRDFDLIISDVKMPGVDGVEFYRRVKTWNPEVASRIVFTTGDTVSPATRDFLQEAGNPCLVKPFRLNEVQEMVTALLRS